MIVNLEQKTIRGIKWSYISTIITTIMQLVFMIVMARLLNPKEFGSFSLAMLVIKFGNYISQMGLNTAIIQKKNMDETDRGTAFFLTILFGVVIFIVVYLFAPVMKNLFHDDSLINVTRVLGISFISINLTNAYYAFLKKEFKFKEMAYLDSITYMIGYLLCGISFAYFKFGIYSLVYATLIQSFLTLFYCITKYRNYFALKFSKESCKSLLLFGSRNTIITFLEYISSSIDTFFVGRYMNTYALGILQSIINYNESSYAILRH